MSFGTKIENLFGSCCFTKWDRYRTDNFHCQHPNFQYVFASAALCTSFLFLMELTDLLFVIKFALSQYLKEIFLSGDWFTMFHKSFFHLHLAQHSLDILIVFVSSIGDRLIVNFYKEEKYEYDMLTWYQHAVFLKIRVCTGRNVTYCHFINGSSRNGT